MYGRDGLSSEARASASTPATEERQGPITVVTSKVRRITFFECPSDLNAMIDLGKIADLVLLMIDAKVGFQMETFEFLNILQVHGMPKVLGILTHLDHFKDGKKLGNTQKKAEKALLD